MDVVVMVGVSHANAPLRVVEQLAIRVERLPAALENLRYEGCSEAVILSTCSRMEIYAMLPGPGSGAPLLDAVLASSGQPPWTNREGLAQRSGREAEAHLFRVTAGLESRVLGEVEIQGQVRSAARAAEDQATMGPHLRELFGVAVATARRAHRETGLAALGRSVGRTGVDAALRRLDQEDVQVAVVGTGRMAAVAFERLAELDIVPSVFGRSVERAERLTGGVAPACGIDQLPTALRSADLVVLATSAPGHLVTAAEVRRAMTQRSMRPLALLDLSVPRNVEASTSTIPGVQVVDLDSLGDEAPTPEYAGLEVTLTKAASIVADGLRRLETSRRGRLAGPIIARLQRDAEELCGRSLQVIHPELVADGSLDRVARTVSRRLVHRSVLDIRAAAHRDDLDAIQKIVCGFATQDLAAAVPPALGPLASPITDGM